VLALCDLLSNYTADDTVITNIYDDIIESWAALEILTVANVLSVAAGQATVTLPPSLLSVLSFIYDSNDLDLMEQRELESLDPGWRNRVGRPRAVSIQSETPRTLRLYPTPGLPSGPDLGIFGEPLGRDYPPYSMVLIGAERRDNLPVQFELPMALLILQREFSRESDHNDADFAALCGQMGQTLLAMARGMTGQA
jgi:hypothetical protein